MLNCGLPGWRVLGQAVLVYLAIASSAAKDSLPGRGPLAEMVAFARRGSVACQRLVPDVEGIHAMSGSPRPLRAFCRAIGLMAPQGSR
jgi:hypothetical protein